MIQEHNQQHAQVEPVQTSLNQSEPVRTDNQASEPVRTPSNQHMCTQSRNDPAQNHSGTAFAANQTQVQTRSHPSEPVQTRLNRNELDDHAAEQAIEHAAQAVEPTQEDQYTLPIDVVSVAFQNAGVSKSKKTLRRYCENNHLDGIKIDNDRGPDKWLVTKSSVVNRINQLRNAQGLAKFADDAHELFEQVQTSSHMSEPVRTPSHMVEPAAPTQNNAAATQHGNRESTHAQFTAEDDLAENNASSTTTVPTSTDADEYMQLVTDKARLEARLEGKNELVQQLKDELRIKDKQIQTATDKIGEVARFLAQKGISLAFNKNEFPGLLDADHQKPFDL